MERVCRGRDIIWRRVTVRGISTQHFCSWGTRCTSTHGNAYIIVYFQFLPCNNYSALVSSFVSPLASSLVSPSFSSSLVSTWAGSDSLEAATLEDNFVLDSWALSKATLKLLATTQRLVSFELVWNWSGTYGRSLRNEWPRSRRWEVPLSSQQQPSIPSFGRSRRWAATSCRM